MVAKLRLARQWTKQFWLGLWARLINAERGCGCGCCCGSDCAVFEDITLTVTPIMRASDNGHTRTITYWSPLGHFWQWRYTAAQFQNTWRHVAALADDPTVDFTWDDMAEVHAKMGIMEATMDCRDVVDF